MFASEATIEAVSSEDALQQAAVELCAPVDAIEVQKTAKNQYTAKVTRCDARIRIAVTEDRLEARAEDWGPAVGDGAEFTLDSLREAIETQGVLTATEKAIYALWNAISSGQELPQGVLARGKPPVEPEDARVELAGNPAYPVFNGEAFGRKIAVKHGQPGVGVDHEPVPPSRTDPPKDITPVEKCGWIIDPETLVMHAKGYGLVNISDSERGVCITPWMRISKDRVRIMGALHHCDFHGKPVDVQRMLDALRRLGVTKTARQKSIAKAIAEAKKNDAPVTDVVLARGIAPQDGQDGRLELKVPRPGQESEDLDTFTVNPRERTVFTSVGEGSIIGRLLEPVPGTPGMDVFGRPIPPKEGQPAQVHAGENVELTPDNEFKALITGVVVTTDDSLKVLDMLEIDGDVDFKTGNVDLEKGLLKVNGSINEGFKVHSPEDVIVGVVVENGAEILCGGNVEVGGGILSGEEGRVKAGGSITCQFMENARVEAGGDLTVKQSISHSQAVVYGRLTCIEGKGVVQGSEIKACEGIEINEAGSEAGVATSFELAPLGKDSREEELKAERDEARARADEIAQVIGQDPPQVILDRTPVEKQDEIKALIKERMRALNREPEIQREIEEIRRQFAEANANARIKIHRQAHPGVTFTIMGKSLTLNEPMSGCTVRYNPETLTVEIE